MRKFFGTALMALILVTMQGFAADDPVFKDPKTSTAPLAKPADIGPMHAVAEAVLAVTKDSKTDAKAITSIKFEKGMIILTGATKEPQSLTLTPEQKAALSATLTKMEKNSVAKELLTGLETSGKGAALPEGGGAAPGTTTASASKQQ